MSRPEQKIAAAIRGCKIERVGEVLTIVCKDSDQSLEVAMALDGIAGKEFFYNTPTVVCMLVPIGGGMLLVRRNGDPGKGLLGLPAGYQDAGETWQQCGARETLEETGYVVDLDTIVAVDEPVTDEYGNNLIFATCKPPRYRDESKMDGEAQEVVIAKVAPPESDVSFPRHYAAMKEFLTARFGRDAVG